MVVQIGGPEPTRKVSVSGRGILRGRRNSIGVALSRTSISSKITRLALNLSQRNYVLFASFASQIIIFLKDFTRRNVRRAYNRKLRNLPIEPFLR
jgi:hypothetical protein